MSERQLKTCRSECISYDDSIGYMTNQPDAPPVKGPHMSQVICGRPECRRRAERQILAFTGQPAVFCEFSDGRHENRGTA